MSLHLNDRIKASLVPEQMICQLGIAKIVMLFSQHIKAQVLKTYMATANLLRRRDRFISGSVPFESRRGLLAKRPYP